MRKIFTSPTKVLLFLLALFFVQLTLYNLNSLDKNINSMNKNDFPVLKQLYQLQSDIYNANQYLRNSILFDNTEDRNKELDKMLITRASATKIYAYLKTNQSMLSPEVKKLYNMINDGRPVYREAQTKMVEAIKKDDKKGISSNLSRYAELQQEYYDRVGAMINITTQDIYKSNKSANIIYTMISFILSVVTTALLFKR